MVVTGILQPKGRPHRRNVYLDGHLAFGCSANVVAKFRLRLGLELTAEQVEEIKRGQVQQECFDRALERLAVRLHSRSELFGKLMRRKYGEAAVNAALDDLTRLGYVNDERYARTKALAAAQHRQHGRRRALMDLLKAGVSRPVAQRALDDVYEQTDSLELARRLAIKHAPRLRRLDPLVARRRLAGMLQRRGFDYDSIKPVIDQVLRPGVHGSLENRFA